MVVRKWFLMLIGRAFVGLGWSLLGNPTEGQPLFQGKTHLRAFSPAPKAVPRPDACGLLSAGGGGGLVEGSEGKGLTEPAFPI